MNKTKMRYHAHVYFSLHQLETAQKVALNLDAGFALPFRRGPLEASLRGPHLLPQFEIDVLEENIDDLCAWLRKNRLGLSVLVHPESPDELASHLHEALWMGTVLPLDFTKLDLRKHGREFSAYGERPAELSGAPFST